MKKLTLLALAACGLLAVPHSGLAQAFTGLGTAGNTLSVYSAVGATPTTYNVNGLNSGDKIIGIDYFTSNGGGLYGMGSSGTLYSLAQSGPTTYAATVASTTNAIAGATVIDFNPMANRLRVYAGTSNFRLTVGVGGLVTTDGTLAFQAGDTNVGTTPNLGGAAYLNNYAGTTGTALYSVDFGLDALLLNTGAPAFSGLSTVATLTLAGVRFDITSGTTGFDISSINAINVAYLSSGNNLYTVNLSNGVLTSLGAQSGPAFIDVAFVPEPGTYALIALGSVGLAVYVIRRRRQPMAA